MKTMDDLRSVIFETIDDVRKSKIDATTAKAISELAQNVINSAKAEAQASTRIVVSRCSQAQRTSGAPSENGTAISTAMRSAKSKNETPSSRQS